MLWALEILQTVWPMPPYRWTQRPRRGLRTRQLTLFDSFARGLRIDLRRDIFIYTKKHFYPHLIRTIWATEYISKTGDFTTAAYMLNDTVETVMRRYQEILEKDHIIKASQFINDLLGASDLRRSRT
jgi:hypothetical protein